MKRIIVILFVLSQCTLITHAQKLITRALASNLDTPWEILWGPDNFIWFTERKGTVSRLNPETGEVFEVISIPDAREVGEGGLLGMVLDPIFQENNYFYVAYNYYAAGNDYREKIVRYTFDPASGKADSPFLLFDNIDGANNHNGCRLIISPDKKLIFSAGDATITSSAQNLSQVNGKILRINLDGSIPDDNPIADNPAWTWGHRNPQGLAYSPDSSILYSSEHGPNTDDEINIITKGRNYGWPTVRGFCDLASETAFCNDSNVVEPIFAWTPTLAVAGLVFYNSDLIPEWKNSLLVSSLKASRITQLLLDESGTSVVKTTDFFTNEFGRLRDLCVSPDGRVYVASSNRDGRGAPLAEDDKIIEITPLTTYIHDNMKKSTVSVFPNPAKEFITVSISGQYDKKASYSFFSLSGQVFKMGYLETPSSIVTTPEKYAGIVLLKLNIDDKTIVKKIRIVR